jgi:hypothetical protein
MWLRCGPKAKEWTVRAADRARRDRRVLALVLGGATYRETARAVGLRSPQSVGNIVTRELARNGGWRASLTDNAVTLHVERSEALWAKAFPAALAGDHRAANACVALLDAYARFYDLATPNERK